MSKLTAALTEHGARLLDIGQAVIHEDLALGILVALEDNAAIDDIRQAVEAAVQKGSTVRITEISEAEYHTWLQGAEESNFILTLLAGENGTASLQAVSACTHALNINIDTIRRLTDRDAAQGEEEPARFCVEMRVSGALDDLSALQGALMEQADRLHFDFSIQADTVFRRNRRLVAFDMDSTLIEEEVMDELAKRYGVGDQVVAITEEAMRGEIDFKESFRRRAALLKGMPASLLQDVANSVNLNTGANRLLKALKHFGYKTAVLSGGFQFVGEHLQQKLGFDFIFANNLEIVDGVMTGRIQGEIVDAQRKATLLADIARQENISLAQTIAIGDGANDLPMLSQAGLGVAFHAKPVVRETASHAISNFGLDAVLYLIGFSDRDITQALNTPT